MIDRTLKSRVLKTLEENIKGSTSLMKVAPPVRQQILKSRSGMDSWSGQDLERCVFNDILDCVSTRAILQDSKTIVFSAEQAEIFETTTKGYLDSLDFKLPFEDIFLQFTRAVQSKYPVYIGDKGDEASAIIGLCLRQTHESKEEYERLNSLSLSGVSVFGLDLTDISFPPISYNSNDECVLNCLAVIFDTHHVIKFQWQSENEAEYIHYFAQTMEAEMFTYYRNLAIACIGYINCENIYLHKEGEVPDKVNRKREREGKKILEPYYVCRIRGVQYDSNGEPTGEGTHHGFRYDVRGHFRRMESGKTTWVRPHQRGLQHELYIPKTYIVEKGAKTPA